MSNFKYQISNKNYWTLEIGNLACRQADWKFEIANLKLQIQKCNGQTLVTLLFFMVIALTITTGAIIVIYVNTQAQTKVQQSQSAYYVAESGAENAVLRLLRDPTYTGELLAIGEGTASVSAQFMGNNIYIATSSGTVGNFVRRIQVTASYTNSVFSVQSWKEIF